MAADTKESPLGDKALYRSYDKGQSPREVSDVPLFNDNEMKLGVFAPNCDYGLTISHAVNKHSSFPSPPTWEYQLEVLENAEEYGFEFMLPIGRWKGHGGTTNHNGWNFGTVPWATGLATHSEKIMCCTTTHVPAFHPLVTAKQTSSIDHISGGRYAMNIVSGWWEPEWEMFFGEGSLLEHDERYRKTAEWVEVLKRIWAEDGWDFHGDYYEMLDVFSQPKPVQEPRPPLINAGNSEAGRDLSARAVDVNFITMNSFEEGKKTVDDVKERAEQYDRENEVGCMSFGLVCIGDTEEEAQAEYDMILEEGDWEATHNILQVLGLTSESYDTYFEDGIDKYAERFICGWGGYPLVGTPEQITDELVELRDIGIEGWAFGFLDYREGVKQFGEEVIPLLEAEGLRIGKYPGNSGAK